MRIQYWTILSTVCNLDPDQNLMWKEIFDGFEVEYMDQVFIIFVSYSSTIHLLQTPGASKRCSHIYFIYPRFCSIRGLLDFL